MNAPLPSRVNQDFMKRPKQTIQDYPYSGNTEENATVVLPSGWTSVDTQLNNIHLHDGVTPGGHVLPNTSQVWNMIAQSGNSVVFSTLAEILVLEDVSHELVFVASDTDARLIYNEDNNWCGTLGNLASVAALEALDKSRLAGGRVTAYVADVAFVGLKQDASKWLYAFVAEMV